MIRHNVMVPSIEDPSLTMEELARDLKLLRLANLSQFASSEFPALERASRLAGFGHDVGHGDDAVMKLVERAVDLIEELDPDDKPSAAESGWDPNSRSHASDGGRPRDLRAEARYTFGLAAGTRHWPPQARRERAAEIYGRPADTYRKKPEHQLVAVVAKNILALLLNPPVTPAERETSDSGGTAATTAAGQVPVASQLDPDAAQHDRSEIARRARRALERGLSNLPLYEPNHYVVRESAHHAWHAFLESDTRTFALVGESGRGKTNTLCRFISDLDDSVIALLYNGVDIGSSLIAQLLEDLLGRPTDTPLQTLRELLKDLDTEVVVALDALNSYQGDRIALSRELDALKDVADETTLRVVVSCTESAWREWRLNGQEETRFARSVFVPDPLRSRRSAGVILGEFTDEELNDAWARRGFRDTDLTKHLREVLRIPEALRLFSTMAPEERGAAGDLPRLIDDFVDEQCRGDPHGARELIRRLAALMLDDESLHLPVDLPELETETRGLQLLESKAIVARGENSLSFRSDVMAQHFLGRVVSRRLFFGRDTETHLTALLNSELEIVTGVVDAALSIAVRDGVDRRRLAAHVKEIASWGARWEGVVSLAVTRDPTSHSGLLGSMCASESYFIRGTAAQALSQIESLAQQAGKADDWRVREAAALSYQYGKCQGRRCLQLWSLASDAHWRVRRAVGYALRATWTRCAKHLDLKLRATMADPTTAWQACHAVLIALGSKAIGNHEIAAELDVVEFLGRCARSANRQVRWLAAYYIPQYPWLADEFEETLLSDDDPWIRATLALSLIEMIAHPEALSATGLTRLDRLCGDPDPRVRIRVARGMSLRQLEVFDERLEAMARDKDVHVRAAVAYSLDPSALTSVDLAAERIAVLDTDPVRLDAGTDSEPARTSKFITDRLAIRFVDDPYVHRFETMRALFAATIDEFSAEATRLSDFIDRMLSDPDEGIRWALVLCLVETPIALDAEAIVSCLTRLSQDGHMWVRREVANALPIMLDADRLPVELALELASSMRADEAMTADDFRDEVEPFLDAAEDYLLGLQRSVS